MSDRTIYIEPLTPDAFAPFGQVIQTNGAHHYPINAGKTERFHDLAKVELGGVHARPLISIFRGQPYTLPLSLTLVERHPSAARPSTQSAMPIGLLSSPRTTAAPRQKSAPSFPAPARASTSP